MMLDVVRAPAGAVRLQLVQRNRSSAIVGEGMVDNALITIIRVLRGILAEQHSVRRCSGIVRGPAGVVRLQLVQRNRSSASVGEGMIEQRFDHDHTCFAWDSRRTACCSTLFVDGSGLRGGCSTAACAAKTLLGECRRRHG